MGLQKQAAHANDPEGEAKGMRDDAAMMTKKIQDNLVPSPPEYLRLMISTPEALGIVMAANHERIGLFSTEGGIFGIMAGRYGDKKGNIDLFLKAHSGYPYSTHRVGREPIAMDSPTLTICLTVQSDVISEIGKNRQFSGRGLLARFLYHKGRPQAGYRLRQLNLIPQSLLDKYRDHIFGLLDIPLITRTLTLFPEAQEIWDKFYNEVEMELRPGGSLNDIKDWGSKLPGAAARIAGLLHYAEHGELAPDIPISVNTVIASCAIGIYYKEHALAAFDLMRLSPWNRNGPKNLYLSYKA